MTNEYYVTYFTINPASKEHKILTFLPELNKNTCDLERNLIPTHINTCICGNLQNNQIYVQKTPSDFHKCPIRVGMGDLHPFSSVKSYYKLKDLEPIREVTGCDYEILNIVASKINANLSLLKIRSQASNAFTEASFVKYLEDGILDICAGGLYRIYGDTVAYSGIYGNQAIIWVYTVERAQRSLENLITKIDGLYIFFLFYLYYSLVWYFLSRIEERRVSLHITLLYSFGTMIGSANLQRACSTKQRIVNGFYLILCIHTVAYINIQLYSFLTISHPPMLYKTNNDIMSSGKKVFLQPPGRNFVDDSSIETLLRKSEYCSDFIDCEIKALKYKGVTIVLDGQLKELQAVTAENDEAKFMRTTENILNIYHEMPISKVSLVMEKLQSVMMRLRDTGILNKLYAQSLGILNVSKSEVFMKNTLRNSYHCMTGCSITSHDFAAAFYLWLVGIALSVLVLLIELAVRRRYPRINNIFLQ
ncbi:uncharacterized protein LOC128675632 [Plodia interpunctella]|uniref:uncharacterized protein LOC128675632 n=1 Tax=Plodia interpunctella TaxID=58824 RepID=UPI0023685F62|nr:uncharacterized protein LOC128675632 [Plodia interpunctella]